VTFASYHGERGLRNREQRKETREKRTEIREQETENREKRSESRDPGHPKFVASRKRRIAFVVPTPFCVGCKRQIEVRAFPGYPK
jgi:hypothetical protein